jgi:hypothetical protein
MHQFARANDGVSGAGLQTFGAADTGRLINDCNAVRLCCATRQVGRKSLRVEQRSERRDTRLPPRWAAVDGGFAGSDCFRIGHTALVTTLGTLRLRQDRIDLFDECERIGHLRYPICFAQSAINCGPL